MSTDARHIAPNAAAHIWKKEWLTLSEAHGGVVLGIDDIRVAVPGSRAVREQRVHWLEGVREIVMDAWREPEPPALDEPLVFSTTMRHMIRSRTPNRVE